MSEETKTVLSSETHMSDSSASAEARSAAPPAIAKVRTLQDVQLEIAQEKERHMQALSDWLDAFAARDAAYTAWNEDPNNEVLERELSNARKLTMSRDNLLSRSRGLIAWLDAERARLQAAEDASFKQKGKYCVDVCALLAEAYATCDFRTMSYFV